MFAFSKHASNQCKFNYAIRQLHQPLLHSMNICIILYNSQHLPLFGTSVFLCVDPLGSWNSLTRLAQTTLCPTLPMVVLATLTAATRLPNAPPSIVSMTIAVKGPYNCTTMEYHYCHSNYLCFQTNQFRIALIRKPLLLILCNNCFFTKILHGNKLFIKPIEIKHQSHSLLSKVHSLYQIVPTQFQRLHSSSEFAYGIPYIK